MREMRSCNRIGGLDRIAVLAALNLAHELLQTRDGSGEQDRELSRTLADLTRRIDGLFDIIPPALSQRPGSPAFNAAFAQACYTALAILCRVRQRTLYISPCPY